MNARAFFPTGIAARPDERLASWLALLVPAALLAGAYGSQWFGGLWPCEMCWWQRYAHFAALAPAALAFAFAPGSRGWRSATLLAAAGVGASGLIGVYHAGVEQQWWEGFTSCTATGARSLQDILSTPLVRCDQIPWQFAGVSMAGWNAIISISAAAAIAWLVLSTSR